MPMSISTVGFLWVCPKTVFFMVGFYGGVFMYPRFSVVMHFITCVELPVATFILTCHRLYSDINNVIFLTITQETINTSYDDL